MNDVTSLDKVRRDKRWDDSQKPSEQSVVDALRKMADDIEAGERDAVHVLICYGSAPDEDGLMTSGFYQAGEYSWFETIGLLERSKATLIGL